MQAQERCIDDIDVGQTREADLTSCFLGARALSVVSLQPDLGDRRAGGPSGVSVTQGAGATGVDGFSGPLWISLSGRQSSFEDAELDSGIATVGGDIVAGPSGIFGVMLQNDYAYQDGPSGDSFDANGYMAGLYGIIQRDSLTFDARVMGGISVSDVAGGGNRADNVRSERWLAALQMSGFMPLDEGRLFVPQAGVTWFEDDMEEYQLGATTVASEQVSYGQANLGGMLRLPFDAGNAAGDIILGGSGIWGFGPAAGDEVPEGLRGRLDLGVEMYRTDVWSISGRITGDGLGMEEYESLGLDLGVTLWF